MTTTTPLPQTTADDYALLRRFVDGDSAEAFATLAARHSDFVFATALRQTRSRDLAEDVTQAVFIVLARRASSIRPGTSIAGFLHQTAVFAARNALRAESRRRKHEANAAVEQTRLKEDLAGPPVETDPAAAAVDRALLRLRGRDRQLLMLHYFDGFTMAEAAAALAISQEAARKRLHRALSRLRELLSRDGTALAQAAVPPVLLTIAKSSAGVKAASAAMASTAVAGGVNGAAFSLAHQVVKIMKLTTFAKAAAATAAVVVVTGSASVAVYKATRPPAPRQVSILVSTPPPAPVAGTATFQAVTVNNPAGNRRNIVIANAPAVDAPDTTHIVDYARVFNQAPLSMEMRAKLERERQAAEADMQKAQKYLSDLKAERDLLKPDTPQYQRADGGYQAAAMACDLASRAKQDAMQRETSKGMVAVFQEIERAVAAVAVEEKITLPTAPGPYPQGIETMDANALRQYLNNRRLLRPAGAPDLTEKVIAKLRSATPNAATSPVVR